MGNKKNSMKKYVFNIIKDALILLVCGILAGYVLLVLVYMIPTERIQHNLSVSAEIFDKEKEYHRVIPGYVSTQLDNYTDSWMVGNAVYGDSTLPVWKRALTCTRAEYGQGPLGSLVKYLSGEENFYEEDYTRYWHGYLVLLKPFFLFFDYADLRFVNFVLEFFILAAVFSKLIGMECKKEAWGYLVAALFIMPVVIPLSIQFSIIFYISQIAALIMLSFHNKIIEKGKLILFFQLIGMCTSYFDLLTYPVASLGMPLICLVIIESENSLIDKIKHIVGLSVSWGFGYASMWAGKWLLSTLILKDNVIMNALEQIAMRSSHAQNGENITFIDIWLRNTEFYFEKPYIIIITVCILIVLIGLIANKKYIKEIICEAVPFLLIAAIPFAWYAVAGQHSYEHHWFTYRGLITTVFACMCILAAVYKKNKV